MKVNTLLAICILLCTSCALQKEYNILDYGAVGDGIVINTSAIQQAINECSSKGGGKVIIPKGTYLSGTIYMKDNVTIYLSKDAILKGSSSFLDYPDNKVKYKNSFSHPSNKEFGNKALLFGERIKNIAITGKGTIDGSGDSPEFQLGNDATPKSRNRPSVICFIKSSNITIEGVRMQNSAYWMQNYLGCDGLTLKGLDIYNHSNFNQDAMDIDASNVLVENCIIDADDDGICLKSHDADRLVENIVIRKCTIATNCNAIKFGTKSDGGFRNIKISDCVIRKASKDYIRKWQEKLKFIELPITVLSGLALESVDGGNIENVHISNIQMQDVQTPIFVIMGRRNTGQADDGKFYTSEQSPLDTTLKVGKVSNLTFKNITATSHSKITSSITAAAGYYVENVILENIKISSMGMGTLEEARITLPEYRGSYPENRMYGHIYPSSGLFLRHAKNVTLNNIELEVRNDDYRPSVILEDVHDVFISMLKGTLPKGSMPFLKTIKCTRIKEE